MSIDATLFPQLAKMQAVQSESQVIGEFIDWLGESGMAICTGHNGLRGESFYPVSVSIETMLARYFNVDLQAAERERRAVLADLASDAVVDPA